MGRVRTGVLISGRGSNMSALIEAAKNDAFPAEIVVVLANNIDAPGLNAAREAGVKNAGIISSSFPDRQSFDRVLDESLRTANVSLVCLAGYMQILSPWFVGRWLGKLINIHPSLLPAYRGLHTHRKAIADGARIHGCTTHFVTPELDAGPIIMQAAVAVAPSDTEASLAARVLEQEHVIYPRTLALVASGLARLKDGRCVLDGMGEPRGSIISPSI
ncbi:phosphoribosylglycinamide formyltransferase [Terrarubrum flagellatum]|uniref:phosphoribosylglycinamide formyltransferase n=1 Tax=Terrirubrum flagellatum TaxID=2895980 RepID=UPI003145193F